MSTLKDVLCLLVIIVAYGIAGRMDYDDAVMLEEAQRPQASAVSPDCAASLAPPPASSHSRRALASEVRDPYPSAVD